MRKFCLTVLAAVLLVQRADADEELDRAIRAAEIATLLRQAEGLDSNDRRNAARVLLESDEAGVRPIGEALVHRDSRIRRPATAAVRGLENPPASLVAAMIGAATERNPERPDLLRALVAFTWGDTTQSRFWLGVAQDDDAAARAAAFWWLTSLPPTEEGVEAVASGLGRNPVEVLRLLGSPMWRSFWVEAQYADVAARARRTALEALENGEPARRESAMRALGHARSGDAETIRALVSAIGDPAAQVSSAAWLALADLVEDGAAPPETLRMGFEGAPAEVLPRFVDAVYGKEALVVDGLRTAFARECALADLDLALALVRAGDRVDRRVVACIASHGPAGAYDETLRSIPGALDIVRDATASMLADTSDFTRVSAVRALGAFPPEEVKADLVNLLRCRDALVLEATVQTLHRLGIGREETIAALTPMLHAGSTLEKITASSLLLDIGVRCPDQAHALEKCLLEPDYARYAAELLGRLGADATPTAPALLRALTSGDVEVRFGACTALSKINLTSTESYRVILNTAQQLAELDLLRRRDVALCCAVWRALLAHPLIHFGDVAKLLRESAVRAGDPCWLDDIADVLARYGPREETLDILVEMLAEPPHRLFAVRLLVRIAPGRAEVATGLFALMREGEPEERREAALLAENAGLHRNAVAVVRLPDLFLPFGEQPRANSGALLPPIDPKVATLCERILLRATGRVDALEALQTMTPAAREAIPPLRDLARRSGPALRAQIERTVQVLGG